MQEPDPIDIEQAQKDQRELFGELKRDQSMFLQGLEKGDLVDGLDQSKMWRLAQVEARNEREAELRFVGWEDRWNERVLLASGRIKPLRSETTSDTSSTKGVLENDPVKLLSQVRQLIQLVSETDWLRQAEAREINIVLRCRFPAVLMEVQKITMRLEEVSMRAIDVTSILTRNSTPLIQEYS